MSASGMRAARPVGANMARWLADIVSGKSLVLAPDDEAATRAAELAEAWADAIPPVYRWASLDDPRLGRCGQIARFVDTARDLVAAPVLPRRITLAGDAGDGKTLLGVAILRALSRRRLHSPMFVSSPDLAEARIQTRAGQGEAPLVIAATRAPLLLLDDLGMAAPTHRDANVSVIDDRFKTGATTIVTTGFTLDQLATKYGDGIARRVFGSAAHAGGDVWIVDFRGVP